MTHKVDAMTKTYPQPIVTVDIVLLSLVEEQLSAALVARDKEPHAGVWTLPGGWIHTDEDEDALGAAARILKEKAGLTSPYLEQLKTFASRHRDARGWSVSIAHYALVSQEALEQADAAGKEGVLLKWRAVDAIRSLPFDHIEILRTAVDRVRSKTAYSSLPVYLMPKTFTLRELQEVYEQVLGGPLDRRSFRRRIEELEVIEPAPGKRVEGGRPAQLFRTKRRFGQALATADKNLELKVG